MDPERRQTAFILNHTQQYSLESVPTNSFQGLVQSENWGQTNPTKEPGTIIPDPITRIPGVDPDGEPHRQRDAHRPSIAAGNLRENVLGHYDFH